MKLHTSFKIGGPADFFVIIKTIDELKQIQEYATKQKIPFLIVGNGTNLLVRDKGIRGIVANLQMNNIKIDNTTGNITVSSDYSVSKMSRMCANEQLTGAEFLNGVPGTVGGAIKMNAGAFGGEIKDILVKTTYMDEDGQIKVFSNEDQKFGYRTSIFKENNNLIILEAEFKLNKENQEIINAKMDEFLNARIEKQPTGIPSAGSVFKRLPDLATAKLIDDCGLKGYKIGDAEVSTKHAGFIVNNGNATAEDVLKLVEIIKKNVYQRFNKEIELEVVIVGEE